jgi:hypothetical protein
MLKGGFPPIYPVEPDSNIETKDHIKRNFSSNNIIDINSILLKKKSTSIVDMLNLSENVKSDDYNDNDKKKNINLKNEKSDENDNKKKKKKNRYFKNEQLDETNFINYINDLHNIKQISRVKKSSKKKSSKKKLK